VLAVQVDGLQGPAGRDGELNEIQEIEQKYGIMNTPDFVYVCKCKKTKRYAAYDGQKQNGIIVASTGLPHLHCPTRTSEDKEKCKNI